MTEKLVMLATHPKWEVLRAVAQAAAKTPHGDFASALARLTADDNMRVRKAAEAAALRRRDWASAGVLGKQHENHLNATLDDIEARFGIRGREAVKRASAHIANTFARELYHEAVRLLSPLATSAERIATRLTDVRVSREELIGEAARMRERVSRLESVLTGMRAYAAQPELVFVMENIQEVVEESVANVRDSGRTSPPIVVEVPDAASAELCRPRIVQALTNLLVNAVEASSDEVSSVPIAVRVVSDGERLVIEVEDHGCGMSEDMLRDATGLFSTSKPHGTGFGLPLAIKIVESEHDGRLKLASRRAAGTTVSLMIPTRRHRART
jgi:nitrogen fixation/metabolism regulation signal transduction histidine kinase